MEDTSAAVFWREKNVPAEWGGYNDHNVGTSVRLGKFAAFGDAPVETGTHLQKVQIKIKHGAMPGKSRAV